MHLVLNSYFQDFLFLEAKKKQNLALSDFSFVKYIQQVACPITFAWAEDISNDES